MQLCESIAAYVDYLTKKNKRTRANHRSPTPVRDLGENIRLKFIPSASDGKISELLIPLNDRICEVADYSPVSLIDYVPHEPVKKLRYISLLVSTGLACSCILLVYSPGGNVGNIHFLWKVSDDQDIAECFQQSQGQIELIKQSIPTYHTRAMRASMFKKFGRISPDVKPAVLRYFYRDLTGTLYAVNV